MCVALCKKNQESGQKNIATLTSGVSTVALHMQAKSTTNIAVLTKEVMLSNPVCLLESTDGVTSHQTVWHRFLASFH